MVALSFRAIFQARERGNIPQAPVTSRSTVTAKNYTYTDSDDAIQYSNSTTYANCGAEGRSQLQCYNAWWTGTETDGDTYHLTAGPSAWLEFTFRGSVVRLMAHLGEASSAAASISVDGGTTSTVDFSSGTNPLWVSPTLDDSQNHTLRLTYTAGVNEASGGSYFIGIDSFIVESTHLIASKNAIGDNNLDDTTDTSDQSSQTLSLAAGLGGALALLLVIIAFVVWWYRRGRDTARIRPLRGYGHTPTTSTSALVLPLSYPSLPTEEHPAWRGPGHFYRDSTSFTDNIGPGSSAVVTPFASFSHQRTASTAALLDPLGQLSRNQPLPQRAQNSRYAYDADHEPAPVPSDSSLALDVSASRTEIDRPVGRRRPPNASPTNTQTSYETWTSSDFGPAPEPFIITAPPMPAFPPHLAHLQQANAEKRPPQLPEGTEAQKTTRAARKRAAALAFLTRDDKPRPPEDGERSVAETSRSGTMPPPYSSIS